MLTEVLAFQEGIGKNSIQAQLNNTGPPYYVIIGNVLTIIFGLFGALLAAYAMWFFGFSGLNVVSAEGDWTVAEEAFIGFVLLATITFVASGSFEYYWKTVYSLTPSASHVTRVGIQHFDMFVTVHRAKNVTAPSGCEGLLKTKGSLFMEVQCGRKVGDLFSKQRNAPKRTCVKKNGIFEETFHFVISPTDDTFRFMLYDQNIISDYKLGQIDVGIGEVLADGFPQEKAYKLHHRDYDTELKDPSSIAGSMVVSYIPGDNYPGVKSFKQSNPHGFEHLSTKQAERRKQFETYGSFKSTTGPMNQV